MPEAQLGRAGPSDFWLEMSLRSKSRPKKAGKKSSKAQPAKRKVQAKPQKSKAKGKPKSARPKPAKGSAKAAAKAKKAASKPIDKAKLRKLQAAEKAKQLKAKKREGNALARCAGYAVPAIENNLVSSKVSHFQRSDVVLEGTVVPIAVAAIEIAAAMMPPHRLDCPWLMTIDMTMATSREGNA